ncbi:MAG: family 43 glycosylhydrolase [Mycobacteriales bacterium]
MTLRPTRHPALAAVSALAVVAGLLGPLTTPAAADQPATYRNPVSRTFADTFADPSVVRGRDGWWYAYGTSDPLRSGERTPHLVPTARSHDLVDWEYVGDAFGPGNRPTWATADAAFWAPDVRYVAGRWVMYFVATQTTVFPGPNDNAIGVATAPTPTGPWTDSGAPVVGPRPGNSGNPDDFKWTFDPAHLVAADGRQYLYYGSYYGGVFAVELTADGTRTVGQPTMVAIDNRYEGAYVVPRDGWYYLFASSSNCCAGPVTGYSVFVGRSRSPLGPFVDKQGISMLASRTGGSIVITPNGNRWVGTGHNAVVSDPSGQDWFVYHAIDRNQPYLDEPFGINRRPMLIDRLDWIGGWPTVRGGAWASDGAQPAPATAQLADAFESGFSRLWSKDTAGWSIANGPDGKFARRATADCRPGYLSSRAALGLGGAARVRAAVRVDAAGTAGLVFGRRGSGWATEVAVRADVLAVRSAGRTWTAALPGALSGRDWHELAAEVRDGVLRVEYGPSGLPGHEVVTLRAPVGPGATSGHFGVLAGCGDIDDVTVAALYRPHTATAPVPQVGPVDPGYSDEFSGPLGPQWTWVREPAATVSGGQLVWPTQAGDLTGPSNNASVLLRDAPAGDYTVETKLTIDLGVDTVRNFQQAGLIVYRGDDDFLRFSHVAIWNTRTTEFGKEQVYAGQPVYGSMLVAPPADTTWLRLSHRVAAGTGEHTYRAGVSTDGVHWIWGGVWTMPAGASPRIGLVSHGGAGATAQFAYFRVHRP